MSSIWVFICLLLGFIVSFVAGYIFGLASDSVHNLIGTLRVDNSIPEDGPQLFLELEKDIPTIKNRDYVTLRVNASNYISQK